MRIKIYKYIYIKLKVLFILFFYVTYFVLLYYNALKYNLIIFILYYFILYFYILEKTFKFIFIKLGIGDWGLGPIPNPQSPIPNPQSPIPNKNKFKRFF